VPASLTRSLYMATKALHTEAEHSGIIRDLLRGTADKTGYALLMRNLMPAYQALEAGLRAHRVSTLLQPLARHELNRALAIEANLNAICGRNWRLTLPLLPAGEDYAARVNEAADGDGVRLIAHAYTRYLGDLSGGRILKRVLARTLALPPSALTFYDFAGIADLTAFKTEYRGAIDTVGAATAREDEIVAEGLAAFSHNIAVSCAVAAWQEAAC
jgi:heme oxygenase